MTFGLFKTAYIEDDYYIAWDLFEYLVNLVFGIDIILTFMTPIYKGYQLEIRWKKIAKQYLKFWFWVDLLSVIPLDMMLSPTSGATASISTLTRVPKIFKVSRAAKVLRIAKVNRSKNQTLLGRIVKYFDAKNGISFKVVLCISFLWFIAHILNCIFFIISENSEDRRTWIYLHGYDTEPLMDTYIACFYYIFTTLTTTGYGDILPVTLLEQFFTVIVMAAGVMIFSLIYNYLSDGVIKKFRLRNDMFREKLRLLSNLESEFVAEVNLTPGNDYEFLEKDNELFGELKHIIEEHKEDFIEPPVKPFWDQTKVDQQDIDKLKLEVCERHHKFKKLTFLKQLPQKYWL